MLQKVALFFESGNRITKVLLFLVGLIISYNADAQQCSGNTVLTSNSGTITDGPGNYNNNQTCTWLIQLTTADSARFSFTSMNMESCCDFVRIYGGTSTSGTLLGTYTGMATPNNLAFLGNTFFITFNTDGSDTRSGFSFNYLSISNCVRPAIPIINYSGPTTIRTGENVTLRTVREPGQTLLWSNGSTADNINVTTQGNYFVRAISNNCTSFASNQIYINVLTGCNGLNTYNAQSGSITDGPNNYENNANCKYLIQVLGATYINLNFSEFNTQLNSDFVRVYSGTDSLGTLLGTYSGTTIPPNLTIAGNTAFIQFKSSFSTNSTGYVINYTSGTCVLPAIPTITAGGSLALPGLGGTVALTSSEVIGGSYIWSNGATTRTLNATAPGPYSVRTIFNGCTSVASTPIIVTQLTGCNGLTTYTAPSGIITDGPGFYQFNSNCKYLIQVPGATFVDLNFTEFQTYDSAILRVYRGSDSLGTLVGTYNGTTLPRGLTIAGNTVFIQFRNFSTGGTGYVINYTSGTCILPAPATITPSDSFDLSNIPSRVLTASLAPAGSTYLWSSGERTRSITVTNAGIYSVRIITGTCTSLYSSSVPVTYFPRQCFGNTTLTSSSGTISDGLGSYTNNQRCFWNIRPINTDSVRFTLTGIDMESCCDFVRIYRGENSFGPLLATYTGNSVPNSVVYSGNSFYVSFTTDPSSVGGGFILNYTRTAGCTAPPTPIITPSGPTTFRTGESIILRTERIPGRTYLWSNGSTADTLRVTNQGSYSVRTFANNCTSEISEPVFINVLTGCSGLNSFNTISGSITDGPTNYENNANCKYLIQLATNTTFINLNFSEFNTQLNSDFVRVYRGIDSLGTLVGTYSGNSLPRDLIVEGNTAFIQFTSNQFTTGTGYVINYRGATCISPRAPTISPTALINLLNTPSVTLTASPAPTGFTYLWNTGATTRTLTITSPGAYYVRLVGACVSNYSDSVIAVAAGPQCSGGVTLTSPIGVISDGIGLYSDFQTCTWTIQTSGTNSTRFNFSSFNLEANFDFLDIFEGLDTNSNRVARFTGTALPAPFTLAGTTFFVRFKTDRSVVREGFVLRYEPVNCSSIPAIPTMIATGPTTFREGGNVTLRTIQTPGVSYIWSDSSTADTLNVTAKGKYWVRAISNGCTSLSSSPIAVTVLTGCNGLTTLNAQQANFYSGTGNYENNSNCKYLIQVPNATSLTVTLRSFNSELNIDFLRIYRGTDSLGTLIGTYSGLQTASTSLIIPGNTAFIQFISNGSVVTTGFAIEYSSSTCTLPPPPTITSSGPLSLNSGGNIRLTATTIPGARYLWNNRDTLQTIFVTVPGVYTVRVIVNGCTSLVSDPATVTLNPGGCRGTTFLDRPSGVVTDGIGDYSNNANCKYLIQVPGASYIRLNFNLLDLQANSDFLRIYQGTDSLGTLIATYPQNPSNSQPLFVYSSNVFIQFISNGSIVQSGYTINYTSDNCIIPPNPTITPAGTLDITNNQVVLTASEIPDGMSYRWNTGQTTRSITVLPLAFSYSVVAINGTCISPRSNIVQTQFLQCSGNSVFTSLSGLITDGQGDYSNNQQCTWLIQPTIGNNIRFNSTTLQISSGDFLEIYDGPDTSFPLLGRFNNLNQFNGLTTSRNSAFVRFITNASGIDVGFNLSYTTITCANSPAIPVIAAFGPTSFRDGGNVVLTVTNPEPGVSYLWSDNTISESLTVTTSRIWTVRAVANGCTSSASNPITVNVIYGCDGLTTLTEPTGTITDGPSRYPSISNCRFLIQVPNATYHILSFEEFEIFSSPQASLTIYQGSDSTGTVIGTYSSNNAPTNNLVIPGGVVFIKFVSNFNNVLPGFIINYTSGNCPLPTTPTISALGPLQWPATGANYSVTLSTPIVTGARYLWSNGQTTRSITVSTPGRYRVRTIVAGCTSAASDFLEVTEISGCNGLNRYTSPTGTISSGNSNDIFNSNCKHLIQLLGATYINLDLTLNNIPANATLKVFQGIDSTGTLLGSFNGNLRNREIFVPGGVAFIQFLFGGYNRFSSYQINYTSGNCLVPTTPTIIAPASTRLSSASDVIPLSITPITGATYIWSNGETSNSINANQVRTYTVKTIVNGCTSASSAPVQITLALCSGIDTLTTRNGTISEGSGTYVNRMNCGWLIAPTGDVQSIEIEFTQNSLEQFYDVVQFYAGDSSDAPVVTTANSMVVHNNVAFVRFISNTTTVSEGFTFNYRAVTCQDAPTPIITTNRSPALANGEIVELTASADTSYRFLWSNGRTTQKISVSFPGSYTVRVIKNNCTSNVSTPVVVTMSNCSGLTTLTSETGGISDGPTNYQNNANCAWHIVRPGATNITIRFFELNTQANIDIVNIYSGSNAQGTLIGSFSGSRIPSLLNIPSDNVFITFVTNSSVTGSGFTLSYSITGGCTPPPVPTITASGPVTFCPGGSVTLTAPSGYASYLWSNGATTQSIIVNTSNSYRVNVTENGCTSPFSSPVIITVSSNPVGPIVTPNGPTRFCFGSTVVLTAPPATGYLWSDGSTANSLTVSRSGTYSVRRIYSSTCTTLPSTPIQVIVTGAEAPEISYLNDDSLTNNTAAESYEWTYMGNIIQYNTRSIPIVGDGLYNVLSIDSDGCRSITSIGFIVMSIKTAFANDIQLYPNPASNSVTIGTKGSVLKSVAIITLEGKVVLNQQLAGSEIQLPLNLPSGMYMAEITTSLGTHHKRLIIK